MDLLHLLLNSDKMKIVCCLCFKQSKNVMNLHENIEIHDEYFQINITLWNIMKHLFPLHELLVSGACEDCANMLIKIFSLLQKSHIKHEMLNYLVRNINEEIDDKVESERKFKKYKLKVNLPTPENILHSIDVVRKLHGCKKCDMKFKSKLLYRKHVKMTHRTNNNAIICDTCGKIFKKSASLRVHLTSHQEKQCPHCFKVLKSHSHYNLHLKNHESPIKRQRRLKYYCCDNCEYRSINKNSLEAHMNKVHLNIRPFVCKVCHKGFYKKSNLTQHFVTHEKVKDKTCEVCGDTFVNEKTLVEHLMIHSGKKPFKCDICGAEFITSGRRLEHMKRKHMEKAECCIICDKRFGLKKDLNAHLKNVHGAENYILKLDNEQTELQVVRVINSSE